MTTPYEWKTLLAMHDSSPQGELSNYPRLEQLLNDVENDDAVAWLVVQIYAVSAHLSCVVLRGQPYEHELSNRIHRR